MLAVILKFFGGGIVGQVGKQINTAIKAKLDAKNSTERIAADENIATLNAQRDILIAEQSDRLTKWIRPAFAAPFILYLWKIIVWDKMLGLGATPDLSTEQHYIMGVVVGAYFLTRPFEKRRK
ncbi:MAG: hypothetical protein COA96_15580 [SAR86 cluster bacterium]|uniref:Holin of 3TMs, for gene-transfer release n=1 Tax=SAR86 cluster bacterium TaxID=2030880 RepID=A0A2A5APU9_9GAMM|nr:MAG: hypothetical protein COA96_15580 [SAR86 cluster bacterium]